MYTPSSPSPEAVLQGLNDFLGKELALCGTWSPTLFYRDLKAYPVKSKTQLAELVLEGCENCTSYLEFFEKSRGIPRKCTPEQKEVFEIFNNGSIMLYFEQIFLRLLDSPNTILNMYMKALSETSIDKWNEILQGLGACCHQFFAKEPESYLALLSRGKPQTPEEMTDFELFQAIQSNLSPSLCRGKVSVDDSRSALIQLYKSKF